MKALMLHSENSAVGKYRIWNPAKYLAKMGWDVVTNPHEYRSFPVDHQSKNDNCWTCKVEGADIIVMQRPDTEEAIALAMALREQAGCPLVFEIDDDIYDVSENSSQYQYWFPGSPLREIAEIMMHEADAITVSTPALVDVYKHLNPNIFVLPNYQDLDDWGGTGVFANYKDARIGWQGSTTHLDDLKSVSRPLKKILRNHKNAELYLWGDTPAFLNSLQTTLDGRWVGIDAYHKALAGKNLSIGIAPVTDRPFNVAKSNIKWQEYSMLGIPTVASKVGEYKQIEHNVTGFLAQNDLEWNYYLDLLVKDKDLRYKIGWNAHEEVRANYSMEPNIHKWDTAYRQIIRDYRNKQWLQTKSASTGATHRS